MVTIKNVFKSYNDKKVIEDVSLHIEKGKITSFYLEFDVHKQSLSTSNILPPVSDLRIHAAAADRLVVQMRSRTSGSIQLRVVDLLGRKLIERPIELHKGQSGKTEIDFPYKKGIYLLQLQGAGWATTERFQWP